MSQDLKSRLCLVLVEPEGRINFGFILRLARNFGIKRICVVRPKFNLRDEEIVEFASKGIEFLDQGNVVIRDSLSECLKDVSFSICTTAKSAEEGDVLRHSIDPQVLSYIVPSEGDIALVFGRESVGLNREELSLCDVISTLDTGTDYNVLNLSHAVSIYLYELVIRSRQERRFVLGRECSQDYVNVLLNTIKDIAESLDLTNAYIALKHVLKRSSLRKDECSILYKFFKKIKYSLKSD